MKLVHAHPTTLEPAGQWVKQGACRDEADAMFPGSSDAETEDAKAVCRRCPVIQPCGQWALDTREPFGVWGGMSEKERANLLRQRGRGKGRAPKEKAAKPPREPAKCGTRSGYQKHLRDKTKICQPCRAANTDADNRLRRTGSTKAAT